MAALLGGYVSGPVSLASRDVKSSHNKKRPGVRERLLTILAGGLALALASSVPASGANTSRVAGSPFGAGNAAESGSPIADQGSSYEYRSEITSVEPKVTGLGVMTDADSLGVKLTGAYADIELIGE